MKPDVNAILKIYLGAEPNGGYQPVGVKERFERAFPNDHAEKLAQIQTYLDQDHQPDWSKNTLAEETTAFAANLSKWYPELDQLTAYSLACRWSYGHR